MSPGLDMDDLVEGMFYSCLDSTGEQISGHCVDCTTAAALALEIYWACWRSWEHCIS